MNLGEEIYVYQYALRILPDDIFEAAIVHKILAIKHRHMFKLLGAYIPSGKMIFTMQPIEETVEIPTTHNGSEIQIIIEKSTETQTLLNTDFINNQNSVVQGIFNIVFKTAFR